MKDDIQPVLVLLRERFAEDVSGVQRLAGGVFSRAYGFISGGAEYVLRINSAAHAAESFAKDAYAARHFASAALPIPRVLATGATPDGTAHFAISERVAGQTLQQSSLAECRAALPAVLDTVEAIGRVDVSASRGFGDWGADGNGQSASWREYLAAVTQDHTEGFYANWHALFQHSFLERDVFDFIYRRMLHLAAQCPEQRALIHYDLWLDASNLLVQDGRVTGVIDWANGLYGDPLYDVACILWGAKWPGWWEAEDVALLTARFGSAPDYDVRVACYMLHIGLDHLRYWAITGQQEGYESGRAHLLAMMTMGLDYRCSASGG